MNTAVLRLGIVTPLANEEDTVVEFLDRVLRQMGPDDVLLCVLDGMCKDRTRGIVEDYHHSRDPRVFVVWAPENRCVVDAYFRGYREAYERGCRWILEMDGGMSHLPEAIPQFLKGMEEGYEYVGGSRYLKGGAHDSPITRRIVSWGGTLLAKMLLRAPMSDMTSGYECFTRDAMKEVLDKGVRSRANFFQTEIRYMMCRRRWKEVPIVYHNENPKIGRSGIRESFRILFQLWRERHKCS